MLSFMRQCGEAGLAHTNVQGNSFLFSMSFNAIIVAAKRSRGPQRAPVDRRVALNFAALCEIFALPLLRKEREMSDNGKARKLTRLKPGSLPCSAEGEMGVTDQKL